MENNSWSFLTLLTWKDLIIVPILLILIYSYTYFSLKKRKYKYSSGRKYIIPALSFRMIGCLLSAMMYAYYYRGGDTFGYYEGTSFLYQLFYDGEIALFFELILKNHLDYSVEIQELIIEKTYYSVWYLQTSGNSTVVKIGGFLSIFVGNSYLAIGLILSFFSFLGCWKIFKVFSDLYPHLSKPIAYASLFIPSTFFWGAAGLMKDTITMAAIGYLLEGSYYFFIKQKHLIKSAIKIFISLYLIVKIKIYIAVAFLPALIIWVFLSLNSQIKSTLIRNLAKPIFYGTIFLFVIFSFQFFGQYAKNYASIETVLSAAKSTQRGMLMSGGSSYDLGDWQPNLIGISTIIPKAINVTLFRPYIWEVSSPILLPNTIESLLFLIFSITVVIKTGLIKTIKIIIQDANLIFCALFAFTFTCAIGLTMYNFGALARIKIPCLPFYLILLIIIFNKGKRRKRVRNLTAPQAQ